LSWFKSLEHTNKTKTTSETCCPGFISSTNKKTTKTSATLIVVVSKFATHKKNHDEKCGARCHGFKACNTSKKPVFVVLVLQVAQKKKTMTMSVTLVVVVSKLATHKKTKTLIVLILDLVTHK
jgi:hypothetical protein